MYTCVYFEVCRKLFTAISTLGQCTTSGAGCASGQAHGKAPFKKTNGCCNSAMAPTIQEVRQQIALPIHGSWKRMKMSCFNSPFVIIHRGVWVPFGSGGQKTHEIPRNMQLFSGWQLHSRKPRKHGFRCHTYLACAECRCMPQILQVFGYGKLAKLHLKNIRFTLTSIYDLWPWIRTCCAIPQPPNDCSRICCCFRVCV